MRVETDLKLGFKDVLIRPKRSTLKSRSLVELDRTYTFLHSKRQWSGVPIIAANMDTIGTFEVAEVRSTNITALLSGRPFLTGRWVLTSTSESWLVPASPMRTLTS